MLFKMKIGNTILNSKTMLIFLMILLGRLAQTTCTNHDIETVYGGYNYDHAVETFTYAVDVNTFDMVAGGTMTMKNGDPYSFLYFIREAFCSVEWHYLFDEEKITSFEALKIRSNSHSVSGLLTLKDN